MFSRPRRDRPCVIMDCGVVQLLSSSKKPVIYLVLVLAGIALGWGLNQWLSRPAQVPVPPKETGARPDAPEVSHQVSEPGVQLASINFTLAKDDGNPLWEVEAEQVEALQSRNEIAFKQVRARYLEKGQPINLKAAEGWARGTSQLIFRGAVRLDTPEGVLTAEEVVWASDQNYFAARGEVSLTTSLDGKNQGILKAQTLTLNTDLKNLQAGGGVEVITPDFKAEGESLEYDLSSKVVTLRNGRVENKQGRLEGKEIRLYLKEGRAVVTGQAKTIYRP